jgi:hypothetical protein
MTVVDRPTTVLLHYIEIIIDRSSEVKEDGSVVGDVYQALRARLPGLTIGELNRAADTAKIYGRQLRKIAWAAGKSARKR